MIYLVRHGEAAENWGAHPNPGLSQKGHNQADSVALELLDLGPIETLYTSPMQRCIETAQPLATRAGITAQIAPAITEIPTPAEISDRRAWLSDVMGGTWNAAPQIVTDWHENLLQFVRKVPDNSVLFTHFVAINAVVGALTKRAEVRVFSPGHTSITTLRRSPEGLALEAHENKDAGPIL